MHDSLSIEDEREERRRQREEAREMAARRPRPATPQPSRPSPTTMPAKAAALAAEPPAFELVGELPETKVGRHAKVPALRAQLIDFARAHPGQWIAYRATAADNFKSPSSLASHAKKGTGGFGPGFEATVREKNLYVRYVGDQENQA